MRWLLYLLILVNISFFVWHFNNVDRNNPDTASDQHETAVKLILLNEKVNPKDSALSSYACYSLGPFTLKEEASSAEKRLEAWGIQSTRRVQKLAVKGYWVMLPPASNRKQAKASVAKLKELNVKDYFLVTTGSKKYAISLGVFSKSSSARRRLDAMKKLGLKPQIDTVDLPRRQYWLDWPKLSTALTADKLANLQKTFKNVGQVERQCQSKP